MQEVQSELMTAVIVASTAFAGLIGLVIWHAMQKGSTIGGPFKLCLSLSFFFGMAAVLLGIGWFYFGESTCTGLWARQLAVLFMTLQIYILVIFPVRLISSIKGDESKVMIQNKSRLKLRQVASIVLTILASLALLGLAIYVYCYIERKGLVGTWFISDVLAGILALVAAWKGTRPNSNIRPILILAIFFFVMARIAQFMIL